MRVMCLADKKSNELEVFEISSIGYVADIYGVKDKDDYDPYKDRCISGLYMVDYDGDYLYIEDISQHKCKEICREILKTGYYDLSSLGEYYVYDDND